MDLTAAAEYLGVSVSTLRWLRRMRKLPFYRIGSKLHVKRHELDEYIETVREPAVI